MNWFNTFRQQNIFSQPGNLILIFLSLAALMITSALYELNQSKKELLELMRAQSHSLLESLIIASNNTLESNNYIDTEFRTRLLNNANFIKNLYEQGNINNQILKKISLENQIYRINIFSRSGKKIFSNHEPEHTDLEEKFNPVDILTPIFTGELDTLILGLKPARYEEGYRYAVALSTHDRSAVVLNIDAVDYQSFRKRIGFGGLLRSMVAENNEILYATLQDTLMILAASGDVSRLGGIKQSPFLTSSYTDSLFLTRTLTFDSLKIFEAVHPFSYKNSKIGLFRLGLSLEPLHDINSRIYRRLIIITIILIALGSFMLTYIFTSERFTTLQKKYYEVETYSGTIINNVSDAIIVYDLVSGIKIFNSAAEQLFKTKRENVLGSALGKLFRDEDCNALALEGPFVTQLECIIKGQKRFLLVSKGHFRDSNENENSILLFRDLTRQKQLENRIEREERLTAMGELASGVAHEIRNPLNTIGTIVQQLNKDFEPERDKEEYHQLAGLVYSEVRRINETIQDFLRFSKPEPIHPEAFPLFAFLEEIRMQYKAETENRDIRFMLKTEATGEVVWDRKQMRQVFINIIQNAVEAIDQSGRIDFMVKPINSADLEIKISDDGPGMSKEVQDRVFNLYYTTKAKGTGIGLSVVQRIIYEHGGLIEIDSAPGAGTTFTIRMPLRVEH